MPFGIRKSEPKQRSGAVIDLFKPDTDIDFNDEDLEAELSALMGENSPKKRSPKPKPQANVDINQLLKDSHAILNEDVEVEDDEELDENLLAELEKHGYEGNDDELNLSSEEDSPESVTQAKKDDSITQLLAVRKNAYEETIKLLEASSDPSAAGKLARYRRILRSLQALIRDDAQGKPIDESALPPLPPPVAPSVAPPAAPSNPPQITPPQPPPPEVAPPVPKRVSDPPKPPEHSSDEPADYSNLSPELKLLIQRHQEYKQAALRARDEHNLPRAKQLLEVIHVLDQCVPRILRGEEAFDAANEMPPPPDQFGQPQPEPEAQALPQISAAITLENLQLRRQVFMQEIDAAKQADNPSKARRLGRITKNFDEAIIALQRGLDYPFHELPAPPGFPELRGPPQRLSPPKQQEQRQPSPAKVGPSSGAAFTQSASASDAYMRRIELLKHRQEELKRAAAQAKGAGNIELAKSYLRQSLGMRGMLQDAEMGRPVDLTQLPPKPGQNTGSQRASMSERPGQLLSGEPCDPPVEFQISLAEIAVDDLQGLCRLLAARLEKQAEEAEQSSEAYRKSGASQTADRLFAFANISRRSTAFLRAQLSRQKRPVFHFETCSLPVLNLNAHLSDAELEVTVLGCASLPLPPEVSEDRDLDTYVRLELPYPDSDRPQTHSTEWARKSANPDAYPGGSVKFPADRKTRSFQRLLTSPKRLKATVYYKRGLFKSHGTIGTGMISLEPLRTQATMVCNAELLQNRRAAGGAVIVEVKQRAPLEGAKETVKTMPWLVVSDNSPRLPQARAGPSAAKPKPCLKVLRLERDILNRDFGPAVQLSAQQRAQVNKRLDELQMQEQELLRQLRNDDQFRRQYPQMVRSLVDHLRAQHQEAVAAGQADRADVLMQKANAAVAEYRSLQQQPL